MDIGLEEYNSQTAGEVEPIIHALMTFGIAFPKKIKVLCK